MKLVNKFKKNRPLVSNIFNNKIGKLLTNLVHRKYNYIKDKKGNKNN